MDRATSGQLSLFSSHEEPDLVRGAAPSARQIDVARRLPANVHLGTSSWSFPGWEGIVYDRRTSQRILARHGLKAYASHPLFRSVGLDRTYYGPISSEEYAAYADAVPDGFRFVVKAHELLTRAFFRASHPQSRRRRNENFLDTNYAIQRVILPCLEGFGHKLGAFLFQFPPQSSNALGGARGFVERLTRFLDALPRGPLYVVELRNHEMLTSRYVRALAESGACHCFNVHPTMPSLEEQAAVVEGRFPATVVRWMLRRNYTYEEAKEAFAPFDRLAAEDVGTRHQIVNLSRRGVSGGQTTFVIVNNKAEGSAPLSVFRLAESMARCEDR
jgi:uncharacterized protein YecE (DUF72 family)